MEFDFAAGKIAVYDHMSDKVTRIDVPAPKDGHGGGDDVLMRNFVELMEGTADSSVASLEDGIRSAQVCLAAKRSSEEDRFEAVPF